MSGFYLVKKFVVILAIVGIVLPQRLVIASESKTPSKPTIKVLPQNSVLNVRLDENSGLTGRTINHNGSRVVGVPVVIKQANVEIARSMTDQQGNFAMPNLKPGLYELRSGATFGTYRVWSEKHAPPSAKPHALLVLGKDGARGQYGLSETIAGENLGLIFLASTTGLALAGLIVALHAERTANSAAKAAAAAEAKSP